MQLYLTTLTYNNKIVAKDSTKTDASNRTYPLSDDMIEFFRWLKTREEEERAACGKDYIENDYIFKWPNGKTYALTIFQNASKSF